MKYFLSLILFIIFVLPVNAFSLFGNQNGIYKNDITKAERLLFGKKNNFYSLENRLKIIEKELFGTVQTGSVKDRISLINRVLANNEFQYYTPRNIVGIKRNFLTNKKSIHNPYKHHVLGQGRMTGFEPPVHQVPAPSFYSFNSVHNQTLPHFSNPKLRLRKNSYNAKIPQPYGYGNNQFYQRMR